MKRVKNDILIEKNQISTFNGLKFFSQIQIFNDILKFKFLAVF